MHYTKITVIMLLTIAQHSLYAMNNAKQVEFDSAHYYNQCLTYKIEHILAQHSAPTLDRIANAFDNGLNNLMQQPLIPQAHSVVPVSEIGHIAQQKRIYYPYNPATLQYLAALQAAYLALIAPHCIVSKELSLALESSNIDILDIEKSHNIEEIRKKLDTFTAFHTNYVSLTDASQALTQKIHTQECLLRSLEPHANNKDITSKQVKRKPITQKKQIIKEAAQAQLINALTTQVDNLQKQSNTLDIKIKRATHKLNLQITTKIVSINTIFQSYETNNKRLDQNIKEIHTHLAEIDSISKPLSLVPDNEEFNCQQESICREFKKNTLTLPEIYFASIVSLLEEDQLFPENIIKEGYELIKKYPTIPIDLKERLDVFAKKYIDEHAASINQEFITPCLLSILYATWCENNSQLYTSKEQMLLFIQKIQGHIANNTIPLLTKMEHFLKNSVERKPLLCNFPHIDEVTTQFKKKFMEMGSAKDFDLLVIEQSIQQIQTFVTKLKSYPVMQDPSASNTIDKVVLALQYITPKKINYASNVFIGLKK